MSESTQEMSKRLEQLVASTRRHLRRNAILVGLGLLIIGGLGSLTAGVLLDILAPFPVWLRISTCVVLWVLVLAVLTLLVFWPAVRPMRLEQIAFRIENVVGRMHNSLVTVIDLRRRKKILDNQIQPFEDRLVKQTTERLAEYRVKKVADPKPVRYVALVAGFTIAIAVILSFLLYERVSVAAMRLLMPTKPIPPVSSVRLEAHPGDISVLFGDPVRLWATVEGEQLDDLTLRLWTDKGEYSTYPMQRDGDRQFAFTLSSVNTSYEYQMIGGRTWTVPNRITVIRRPIIEKLSAEIHLPDYMKISQPRRVSENARQISAPAGSAIHLKVAVSGDVAKGEILLFRADKQAADQTEVREVVWFDDDVPADAELMGKWRWTSGQTYSGSRAHTFSWARRSYGFRTRLHPLTISPDESLFLYTRLDPTNFPERLRIRVLAAGKTYELIWDSSSSPLTEEHKEDLNQTGKIADSGDWFITKPTSTDEVLGVYAGRLPKGGAWNRLEIPASKLKRQDPNTVIKLAGMQYNIDKGSILFDRAGTLRRTRRTVKQTNLERIASVPMHLDKADNRWVGAIPVAERYFSVEFRNRLDYPSAPMKAIPIIPTDDQKPTILIERPGKNLVLSKPQPVPLIIRTFDDFGIADITIQTGSNPDHLDKPRELAQYDQPQTNRKVTSSLDTKDLDLQSGQPIYYRIFARDLKGQQGKSELFRIGMEKSSSNHTQEVDRENHALAGILDNISQLFEMKEPLSLDAVENITTLPENFEVTVDSTGTVTLLNPDGTMMTAEDMKQVLTAWNEGMTDDERRQLSKMYNEIQQERQELLELSQRFYEAAEAEKSMLTLPAEAEALRAMALRAQQVSDMYSREDSEILSEDILQRLGSLQELTPDQQRELSQLQQQLQQIITAREALAASPTQSQESLSSLMAQLQAQQAMDQLQNLNTYLQSQKELLEELRQQVTDLREITETAEPPQLEEVSSQQQELDPEALELISRLQELLQQRMENMQQDEEMMPLAPWVPPGRAVDGMPTEADTPEEDPEKRPGMDIAALKQRIEDLQKENDLDWWDQPVEVPPAIRRLEVSPRFANRDSRPTPAPLASNTTPRQMLMQHQDNLQQTLTANSNELSAVQNQLSRTVSQLNQLSSKTGMSQIRGLTRMLGSSDLREALGMSSWAARNFQSSENFYWSGAFTGRGGGWSDNIMRTDRIISVGYDDDENIPVEGAMLYRLPPWLRQPLIQSMQERGPEAYQPLIEAYYRDLSAELEK